MALCLVVGERNGLTRSIEAILNESGHVVLSAEGGSAAVNLIRAEPRMAIILAYLPPGDALSLCRLFRSASNQVGLLVAIAGGDDRFGTTVLGAGADVYLAGATNATLVVAALEALQRRLGNTPGATWPDRVVVNELELDLARGTVRLRGVRIDLTPSEFRILRHLAVNAGRVEANEVLVRDALGYTTSRKDASDILKVHVRHLREKIEPQPSKPIYLLNVRGLGYMLERRRRGRLPSARATAPAANAVEPAEEEGEEETLSDPEVPEEAISPS